MEIEPEIGNYSQMIRWGSDFTIAHIQLKILPSVQISNRFHTNPFKWICVDFPLKSFLIHPFNRNQNSIESIVSLWPFVHISPSISGFRRDLSRSEVGMGSVGAVRLASSHRWLGIVVRGHRGGGESVGGGCSVSVIKSLATSFTLISFMLISFTLISLLMIFSISMFLFRWSIIIIIPAIVFRRLILLARIIIIVIWQLRILILILIPKMLPLLTLINHLTLIMSKVLPHWPIRLIRVPLTVWVPRVRVSVERALILVKHVFNDLLLDDLLHVLF